MKDTHLIGNRSQAKIIARLTDFCKTILLPLGDGCCYDLVVHHEDKFITIQCKTGRHRNGAIVFNAYTVNQKINTGYHGKVDYFAIYSDQTQEVYLVPVSKVKVSRICLWLDRTQDNQTRHFLWAEDFTVDKVLRSRSSVGRASS